MIQRLIDSLQALAALSEVQGARFGELVSDFDDAFLLIRDCQQLMLTSRQMDALVDLDLTLTAMTRAMGSQAWTADVLRDNPDCQVMRRQAAAALDALARE